MENDDRKLLDVEALPHMFRQTHIYIYIYISYIYIYYVSIYYMYPYISPSPLNLAWNPMNCAKKSRYAPPTLGD